MSGILSVLFVVCWIASHVNGQCGGKADIVIAIPGAHEVPQVEFAAFEEHLIELLYHFKLTSSDINIGLIVYGAKAVPKAWPQPFMNRLKTNTKVSIMTQRNIKYTNITAIKETKVSVALSKMHEMLIPTPSGNRNIILRSDARKIGIIYTWGKAITVQEKTNTILEAGKLRADNVIMYALGANETGEEFETIGTDNCRLFSMGNFTYSLPAALSYLAGGVCSELDPSVTVESGNCYPKQYGKALPIISNCDRPDYPSFADPNNCAYQLRCDYNTDGEPQRQRCAPGTLYSPKTRACVHEANSVCFVDVFANCPIDAEKDNILLPHPADCTQFVSCGISGLSLVLPCPGGLFFDVNYGQCNHTWFVDCNEGRRPMI